VNVNQNEGISFLKNFAAVSILRFGKRLSNEKSRSMEKAFSIATVPRTERDYEQSPTAPVENWPVDASVMAMSETQYTQT
jgi:hypothetical protein